MNGAIGPYNGHRRYPGGGGVYGNGFEMNPYAGMTPGMVPGMAHGYPADMAMMDPMMAQQYSMYERQFMGPNMYRTRYGQRPTATTLAITISDTDTAAHIAEGVAAGVTRSMATAGMMNPRNTFWGAQSCDPFGNPMNPYAMSGMGGDPSMYGNMYGGMSAATYPGDLQMGQYGGGPGLMHGERGGLGTMHGGGRGLGGRSGNGRFGNAPRHGMMGEGGRFNGGDHGGSGIVIDEDIE